jgi:UPF0271 protein
MGGPNLRSVDLNADLGEGYGRWRMGDDEALLDVVTTANIACGFHAGDPLIMRRTVALAVARGVAVGAHPGLNDLWGFGRRQLSGERPDELATMVVYQVGALRAIAAGEGAGVGHVKLHGVLSNAAAVDPELAGAIAAALRRLDPEMRWLVPTGSVMVAAAADAGLTAVAEAFCDRGYSAGGDLLPRSHLQALLSDPEAIAANAVAMATSGAVTAITGQRLPRPVQSLCVHGDTPGAVAAARAVRRALLEAGISVAPF